MELYDCLLLKTRRMSRRVVVLVQGPRSAGRRGAGFTGGLQKGRQAVDAK